ncbi:hypothetical protein IHE44_0013646 [Lamprotornis superbus]|uniref:Uncharacterized protein n=1 Tax=Lamprotornis superbus TaxID=245042 RepID=A0A835TYZ2_9PASS|nr:hypothetical protein IHE44_0013646 [Lamprotornis superbus]
MTMVQTMIPKALRPMKFYFSTVYQEIWVGVALTSYAYYKISFGGKKSSGNNFRIEQRTFPISPSKLQSFKFTHYQVQQQEAVASLDNTPFTLVISRSLYLKKERLENEGN